MALIAGISGVGLQVTGLAGQLFRRAVLQRKNVPGQVGRRPGFCGVAASAICAKLLAVNVWFPMAGGACAGCAGISLVGVAIAAVCCGVSALQGKKLVVVKTGHPVLAIMAINAACPIRFDVPGGELVVFVSVAGEAVERIAGNPILAVAAFAGKRAALVINLMVDQAKVGQPGVVNINKGKGGNIGLMAFVFGVAILALLNGDAAVHAIAGGSLAGHVHVAILAAGIGDAVDGDVAVGALLLKFGVGGVAAQRLAAQLHGR